MRAPTSPLHAAAAACDERAAAALLAAPAALPADASLLDGTTPLVAAALGPAAGSGDEADRKCAATVRALVDAGASPARDMTFEAAITKTMWALAQPEKTLREWFDTNLAGEVSLG